MGIRVAKGVKTDSVLLSDEWTTLLDLIDRLMRAKSCPQPAKGCLAYSQAVRRGRQLTLLEFARAVVRSVAD
jgi:hypothetical protein